MCVHLSVSSVRCALSEIYQGLFRERVNVPRELVFSRMFRKKSTFHRWFFEIEINHITGIRVSPMVILLSLLYLREVSFWEPRLSNVVVTSALF